MSSPETCVAAAVQVRLSGAALTSLENWRRSQQKIPARSEALRILVERALAEDNRPPGEAGASTARKLGYRRNLPPRFGAPSCGRP